MVCKDKPILTNRIAIFDIVKFFLSLMVVAIHCELFPLTLYPWLRLAVPLFFVISSYLFFGNLQKCKTVGEKNQKWLNSFNATPVSVEDVLYIKPNDFKDKTETVSVTDFVHTTQENPITYNFTLVPYFEGTGKSLVSSFYIVVEKTDKDGKQLEKLNSPIEDFIMVEMKTSINVIKKIVDEIKAKKQVICDNMYRK